jgi:hypothetical protein
MKYLFALSFLVLFSCSHKEDNSEWKEMEEFHTVMADVYHPLKDAKDLGPIKQHADELAASATKWAEADLPSKVDNDETRGLLNELKDGCQHLATSIKDGGISDEELSAKLTALHDTFHSIMEKWYQAGKEEGSEEHHEHH